MMTQEPSKITPGARASKIWKKYGFTSPVDLVLEDLAMAHGVLVVEGRLDTADARLIRKGKRGLIRLKEDIPEPGRKRFAVAHELGHWVLHELVSQILSCTSDDMVAKYKASVPEVEANYFAAELLMPQSLFRPRIHGAYPSTDVIRELAEYFQTSLTATAVRFIEVADEPCAMVVSERGRVRWWRASERLAGQFWLEPKSEVSAETVAGAYFSGEPIPAEPEEVDAEAWLGGRARQIAESLFESAVPLDRYGQVISLLWPG